LTQQTTTMPFCYIILSSLIEYAEIYISYNTFYNCCCYYCYHFIW